MIRSHSIVLVSCSTIGFAGHYLQFGNALLTPWIPAAAGILIMLLDYLLKHKNWTLKYLPIIGVFAFGVLTTNMCLRFLPQDFQPVRKKIIFSLMSVSALVTVLYQIRTILKAQAHK